MMSEGSKTSMVQIERNNIKEIDLMKTIDIIQIKSKCRDRKILK